MRENTAEAFRRCIELNIDAVEMDIQLSRDGVAVLHHDFYLADADVPVFGVDARDIPVPRLDDILREFAGRIGLEIELKGPDIHLADVVVELLNAHRDAWQLIEVTSSEPATLLRLRTLAPELATALLFPPSESWMRADVVAYAAVHRAVASGATAVHLSATQIEPSVIATVRQRGIDVHAHSVNDDDALRRMFALDIPWMCSDRAERAVAFRSTIASSDGKQARR